MAFAVQERAIGRHHENLVFIKPPFYALPMWPLAQLPFVPAFYLFRALVLAGVGLFPPGLLPALRMEPAAGRAVAAFAPTPLYVFLPRGAMQVAVVAIVVAAMWMMRRQPVQPEWARPGEAR